jgi:hypothetical protein
MKLKEWIDFNEKLWNGDLIIKCSSNNKKVCETSLDKRFARKIFGEYPIIVIGFADYPGTEIRGLRIVVDVDNKE